MTSRHDRLKELFIAARDLSSSEREAFLRSMDDDEALLDEVRGLLRAEEDDVGVLDGGIEMQVVSDPEEIGPFRIIDRLGEGGMGIVYVAEQTSPVIRRVAIKVIRLGMESAEILERFRNERQTLAIMEHPSIARVYEAGVTEHGRLYFVMELVDGVRLNEYCTANEMPTDERLQLVVDVCRAVQHAHTKGVIHRDLKPSNVLVGLRDRRQSRFPRSSTSGSRRRRARQRSRRRRS